MLTFQQLRDVSAVFWDFDNTLCIWGPVTWTHEDAASYAAGGGYTDQLKAHMGVNPTIEEIVNDLAKHAVRQAVLSHVTFGHTLFTKQKWVQEKYPDAFTEFYGVNAPQNKVEFMKKWYEHNNKHGQIVLVDDLEDTCSTVRSAGFEAYTPMQLIQLYVNRAGAGRVFQ